jgi:hypothetical protein
VHGLILFGLLLLLVHHLHDSFVALQIAHSVQNDRLQVLRCRLLLLQLLLRQLLLVRGRARRVLLGWRRRRLGSRDLL